MHFLLSILVVTAVTIFFILIGDILGDILSRMFGGSNE